MFIRTKALSITLAVIAGGLSSRAGSQTLSPRPEGEANLTVSSIADSTPAASTAGGLDLIDEIWNLLNSVSTRVNTAITRATEARDRAVEARNHAANLVTNMADGASNLSADMRDRIEDAVAELEQALQQELAGAEEFTNGANSCSPACEDFRADLIALLSSLEEISNALLEMSAFNGQTDFSNEIAFIESLPGTALFPLYRVFQALPILDEAFLMELSQTATDLQDVATFVQEAVGTSTCELLVANKELFNKMVSAARSIDKVGKVLKGAGGLIQAIGKSKIGTRVGIWGWAGVSYTSGLLERFGGHIASVANRLTPIADKVERKLQYCILTTNQSEILELIELNRQQLMDAIKAIPHDNDPDLNGDGIVNLADYSSFQNAFGKGS